VRGFLSYSCAPQVSDTGINSLSEGLLLLLPHSPGLSGAYQFFAMMLLPMGLRGFLSLFDCLIVGLDDLFLRF
jgi:hypothetical protein